MIKLEFHLVVVKAYPILYLMLNLSCLFGVAAEDGVGSCSSVHAGLAVSRAGPPSLPPQAPGHCRARPRQLRGTAAG